MTREDIGLEDTEKFLGSELQDPTLKFNDEKKITFNGLSKDEIMQYGTHPFWVKIRWFLFILFWVVWVTMLVAAVLIVVFSPKCPYRPKLKWWQNEPIYQLDVENFADSNEDGVGDLNGLIQKLSYFNDLGIKNLCLKENILKTDAPTELNQAIGSKDDFDKLKKEVDSKDMRLIVDIPFSKLKENDTSTLEHWLTYVDGVRIVEDEVPKEILDKWVTLADNIHSKTFKHKLVAAVTSTNTTEDEFKETYLNLNADFSSITKDDLKDVQKLLTKLQVTENGQGYVINKYQPTRISDKIGAELLNIYHSLLLLLRGSPLVLYGDEIGLSSKDVKMKWDDTSACGFTSKTGSSSKDCGKNVKESFSSGSGQTLAKVYNQLLKLRQEPSFKWGRLNINKDVTGNVVSYVREATGFEGYIVAANIKNQAELVDFRQRHKAPLNATVTYFYSYNAKNHDDFQIGSQLKSTNIMLHPFELIVLKFSN